MHSGADAGGAAPRRACRPAHRRTFCGSMPEDVREFSSTVHRGGMRVVFVSICVHVCMNCIHGNTPEYLSSYPSRDSVVTGVAVGRCSSSDFRGRRPRTLLNPSWGEGLKKHPQTASNGVLSSMCLHRSVAF